MDPLEKFRTWLAEASDAGILEPTAMTLATAAAGGAPSARMVLLKGLDQRGFAFFTNYESAKARDLAENPRAALVFHWQATGRQVRVTGRVRRMSRNDSAAYFRSRPLGSRLSAWASPQSEPIESLEALEERVVELARRWPDGDVPLPRWWGGYRVVPDVIEFWTHRDNRLHDRVRYRRRRGGWVVDRLAP